MITELLHTGRENTQSAREIAAILGMDIRDVTHQIEKERRAGQPICAATGRNPGYYLAADAAELRQYCDRLSNRGHEIFKTRGALIDTLRRLQTAKKT